MNRTIRCITILLFCSFFTTRAYAQGVSSIDSSIYRSIGFFEERAEAIHRTDIVMILSILNEHYRLNMKIPTAEEYLEHVPELNGTFFKLSGTPFAGRYKPGGSADSMVYQKLLRKNMHDMDYRSFWSMYCDVFPFPDTLLEVINEQFNYDPYDKTHAAFHFANIAKNKCVPDSILAPYIERSVDNLLQLLNSSTVYPTYDTDVRIEALVMLMYLGRYDLVGQEGIDYILRMQRPDGGWSAMESYISTNTHSALLGLWALLLWKYRY